MQGPAQSNNGVTVDSLQKLSDSDTVTTQRHWYATPGKYPISDIGSETWKDSHLEFAANNKFRLIKQNSNDEETSLMFASGDYLFDYANKLLYLRFTDFASSKSNEMVFKVTYCKEKKRKIRIMPTKGGILYQSKKTKYIFVYFKEISRLPIKTRKNLRHWNGALTMYRYVGVTWDMPITEISKCETVNSGITYVQKNR